MVQQRGKNTITARLALDGGKEFREDLKALGEEGEKALGAITQAAKNLRLGDELQGQVKRLQASFADLRAAADRVRADFKRLGDAGRDLGRSLATVGRNLAIMTGAAAAAGAAIFTLARNGSAAADAAAKQAQSLGLTIDGYGRLQFAAEQSGVSTEKFGSAMTRLNQTLQDAADGNDAAAQKFSRLGIAFQDTQGNIRSTEEILGDLADRFSRMPDGIEKSALAVDLFGRQVGPALIPFLNEGRAGLDALGKEAERLGLVFTESQAKIATALQDSLNRFTRTRQALANEIGLLFAPTITRVVDGFTESIARNRQAILDWTENSLGRALKVVGELIELFVIGGAEINKLDPKTIEWGVAIIEWRNAIKAFGEDVRTVVEAVVIPAFDALMAVFDVVAAGINAVFGTDFSGRQVAIATAVMKLVGVFGVLASTFGLIKAAIPLLISAFGLLAPAVGTLTAAFGVFVAGLKLAGAGILAVAGWPVAIAAAVGAIAVTIYMFWDEIVDYGAQAWEAIKDGASGVASAIGDAFASIGGQLWEDLKASASSTWDAIASGASAAGSAIADAFSTIREFGFDGVAQVASRAWDGIAAGASSLVDGLRRTFEGLGSALGIVWEGIAAAGRLVWSGIEQAASAAWAVVGNAARSALDGIAAGWSVVSEGAAAAWREVSAGAENLWRGIIAVFERNQGALIAAFERLFAGLSESWQKLIDEAQRVRDQLIAPFQQAGDRIRAVWDDTGQAIARAVSTLPQIARDVVAEAARAIDGFADIGAGIERVFRSLAAAIDQIMRQITQRVEATIRAIEAALARLEARIRRVQAAASAAASSSSSSSSGSAQGFASGGHVKGPGTGTSDSIPAWLSAGEFVTRARAVQHYGAEFFASLNQMRIPKDAILDMLSSWRGAGRSLKGLRSFAGSLSTTQTKAGLPAFSMGGLVDAFSASLAGLAFDPVRLPALAPSAHPMANLHPVTLDLGGGRQVEGLYAGPDVIDEIAREAAQQRLLSLGPAPGWSGSW